VSPFVGEGDINGALEEVFQEEIPRVGMNTAPIKEIGAG
jgi:hypothetical protein